MLSSYCDEFGHADDPTRRVMGVAGLLARSEAWAQFVSEGDTICDEEEVPKPFHMVDFVHQKEDFKSGWESEDKRLRVLDRLLCAIEKIQAMPIGAAVVLDDFRNLGDSQRERLRSPYFVAFQQVTYDIAFATAPYPAICSEPTEVRDRQVATGMKKIGTYLKFFCSS
jgi:hypothetical protein